MSLSNYLETAILNHLFRTATLAKPSGLWISLHTADPTEVGATAEVSTSGTGYARVAISVADASWSAPADNSGPMRISNLGVVTFPTPTLDWGIITHFGIEDAATAGNSLASAALGTSRTILAADGAPFFGVGTLTADLG